MGYSKLKVPKVCEQCKKPFEAKTTVTRFCSKACAYNTDKTRKKAERKEAAQQELIAKIPDNRPYISVAEAVLLFDISRDTIYRLVRLGKIPAVNLGERLTRISRAHIEAMFKPLPVAPVEPEKQPMKMDYSQEECYTFDEISEKYGVSPSTVKYTIRRHSIPQKHIGKRMYVPKVEIDKIFTNKK